MINNSLTQVQNKMIDATGKVVLKACPGSGKTHVVANKVIKQVLNWKTQNRGAAILSFTNVACEELKERVDKISNCKIGYPHYIGTLDSFISQYIFMPFGHMIMNCTEKPAIIQDFSINALQYSTKIWKETCHKSGCDPLDFYYDQTGILTHKKKDITTCSVTKNKPCEKFKLYCYKNGYATYQDVIMIALRILKINPNVARLLTNRFPVLIIDEAQDISAEQMELIDVLVNNGLMEIMLIGDPDQAIYEWRDADPSVFMGKYKNNLWDARLLNENFRCSQNICNATKVFSTLPEISVSVGKSAMEQFVPEIIKYDPKNKQEVINYFLETCKTQGIEINNKKIAILVRGKSGLLGKDYSQIKDLWKNQFTKLLSEATYEKDMGSLNRTVTLIEKALYSIFIKNNISNEIDKNEIIKVIPEDIWRKMLFEFCKRVPSSNVKLKEWVIEITTLINYMAKKHNLNIVDNCCQIKIKSRVMDVAYKDFLEQPIRDFYAKTYKGEYLNATIHAVKGRTFEAVLFIIGTNGKLTSNMLNTYPIESEAIRTGYVAMTRARRILMVAVPKSIKDSTLVRFDNTCWNIVNKF